MRASRPRDCRWSYPCRRPSTRGAAVRWQRRRGHARGRADRCASCSWQGLHGRRRVGLSIEESVRLCDRQHEGLDATAVFREFGVEARESTGVLVGLRAPERKAEPLFAKTFARLDALTEFLRELDGADELADGTADDLAARVDRPLRIGL